MNSENTEDTTDPYDELTMLKKQRPFRKAVLRGFGVVLPPLLTLVLFLWAWNIIVTYVLEPVEDSVLAICVMNADIRNEPPKGSIPVRYVPIGSADLSEQANSPAVPGVPEGTEVRKLVTLYERRDGFVIDDKAYIRIKQRYIPEDVYRRVEDDPGDIAPTTPKGYYRQYFRLVYLQRYRTVPIFLLAFVLVLYLLGKFLAAGVGRWVLNLVEGMVGRLPIVSTVYSSVKQVTDFAFSQTELQYTRVVAVQYPRKGCWSLAFVTGEGMLDVRMAANEPVMAVLVPTSPMPATGFVITVPKSETIDLNITIDQAIQFCVSCGVVVPGHQQQHHLRDKSEPQVNPLLQLQQPGGPLYPGDANDSGSGSDTNPNKSNES